MKKISTLFCALLLATSFASASGYWARSFVTVTSNATLYNYGIINQTWTVNNTWTANTGFNNYDFGTVSSLVLNGGYGEAGTWGPNDFLDASSFVLYYRVYPTNGTGGSWSNIPLTNLYHSTGSRSASTSVNVIYNNNVDANVDLKAFAGNTNGTYYLEVILKRITYYENLTTYAITPWTVGNDGASGFVLSNASVGYKAQFTINDPITVSSGAPNISTLAVCPTCDLIVNNGAELIVDESRTYKSLTVLAGGKVTNDNVSATTLSITNNLVLESNAANGTATYVEKQGGALSVGVSGTSTVKQYISSTAIGATGRNWYISSPLSAALSSTITTATENGLVYYNGTTWADAGTTMDIMKGYIAKSPNGNKTIQFTGGNLNTGTQSVSDLPEGFNLVGNPYPSSVDFDQATKTNVSSSIWYRSKQTGSYVFQTYNVPSNIGANDGTAIIPPMQSFWIKTTSGSNTFGFTNAMRSHANQSVTTNRLKVPKASTQQLLRLQLNNGITNDEAVVYFNQNAQNTLDDYDTQKMFVNLPEVAEIYTLLGTDKLVINGMNAMPENVEIPLGITAGNATSFSLKATELTNFETGTEIILKDYATGNTQDLSDGSSYDFDNSLPVTNRFALIFKAPAVTTAVNPINKDDATAWIFCNANNQIVVNCKSINAASKVAVLNAVGQKLVEKPLTKTLNFIDNQLKSGVYFVTVSNGITSTTQKVILK